MNSFLKHNLYLIQYKNTSILDFTLKNCTFSFCSFSSTTKEAYNTIQKQKEYLNSLGKDLNINSYEDWYRISPKTFGLLYFKYPSILNLLQTIYPNYIWSPWKFSRIQDKTWDKLYHRRQHFDDISKNLNLTQTNDWYKMTSKQFYSVGNSSFLNINYKSNLFYSLIDLYPEISWIPWNFAQVPDKFWTSLENKRRYFKYLEQELNITSMEDWYSIPILSVLNSIYKIHNSMYNVLKTVYPDYIWLPWKFEGGAKGCWYGSHGIYNRRYCMNDLGEFLKVKSKEDWYSVTIRKVFAKNQPSFLKMDYNANLFHCFLEVYPEFHWIPWKFSYVPKGFWGKDKNVLQFLNWCEKENNMKSKNDWYYFTNNQLKFRGGKTLLVKWKGIFNILNHFFPNENWDKSKFKSLDKGGKSQHRIASLIQDLIGDEIVFENYKHSNIYFKNTKKKIELDIFIPSLNIAFEYQGKQHYENSNDLYGTSKDIKERDLEKKELCLNNSITLIEIPFTWDQKKSSLKKIINSVRPDILK